MTKTFAPVNEEIEKYVEETFEPEDAILKEIRKRALDSGLPDIHVSPMDGLHLEVIARAAGTKKSVEIGTLAGYSGVCIARALPLDGRLFTFEFEPRHAEVAAESFKKAGLSQKVQIIIGPAIENLKKIESQSPFDFVFIDADKESYPAYLEWTAKHLRVGGVFLADNTFAFGMIADKQQQTNDTKALREFNNQAAHHAHLRSTILPTGEGLTFGVKIKALK